MAKSSKSARTDRRKVVEQLRAEQKAAERRRGTIIVVACVLVAVGIVAAAAFGPIMDSIRTSKYSGKPLTGIGSPASVCQKVTTKPADGQQQHLPDGSPVSYPDAPPAFGKHYLTPDAMARKFYTSQDRPALGTLVHNEEHGYTIIWYDDTAAKDKTEMKNIEAIAKNFQDDQQPVIAAPWTSEDGKAFPDGKHIALTRWTADPDKPTDEAKQRGNWQYCGATSGKVVADFVNNWSSDEAPEPDGG